MALMLMKPAKRMSECVEEFVHSLRKLTGVSGAEVDEAVHGRLFLGVQVRSLG
jgi:hypothetical protein